MYPCGREKRQALLQFLACARFRANCKCACLCAEACYKLRKPCFIEPECLRNTRICLGRCLVRIRIRLVERRTCLDAFSTYLAWLWTCMLWLILWLVLIRVILAWFSLNLDLFRLNRATYRVNLGKVRTNHEIVSTNYELLNKIY